jgi:hypothetical protein
MPDQSALSRRRFLQVSALAVGAGLHGAALPVEAAGGRVVIVASPEDPVATAPPVRWAVGELRRALEARGLSVGEANEAGRVAAADLRIVVSRLGTARADSELRRAGLSSTRAAEALALLPVAEPGGPSVLAAGVDARGAMYAVLELAERVAHAADPLGALRSTKPLREAPFNAVRAIGRPFVSDIEDKPWFNDRAFWPDYFGMLARQRVNRFHLSLGFGYDTLRTVTDAYLLFPYPFLVSVPGHAVRAVTLPDAERESNLEMLRFISAEAAARGIDFQLGIWTHGYTWEASPNATYTIEGLHPGNHAAYCRDALAAVLSACPAISGVTLRTHYESGVREGSYAFWRTIFEGVPRSGRPLEIELHTKGLDQKLVAAAQSVGVPVRLSAKYWAEHTGLPYHQAAIRELELPHADPADTFSALSFGSRNHTRYGYADFLEEARSYGFMFRVFPGTHKFLLWGDPVTAAAHARAFSFCGSQGAELLEPLAFKGRRGSGLALGRCGYRDVSLSPRRDWEKFLYTYTLWGRLLYNPDADPATWRRVLTRQYGPGAAGMEAALGSATRILPIVTTAHLPSAAHDTYSPEFYVNQSIADPSVPVPYGDTPMPRMFATTSPLDPQLFSTIEEWADRALAGAADARYSATDVARWLDDLGDEAAAGLAAAERAVPAPSAEFRRAAVDVRMQAGLGRFFAAKLRSGALHAVHRKSGSREALAEAVKQYRRARDAWERLAREAEAVYVPDITFGPLAHQRGHWLDRLPAIDADLVALERAGGAADEPGASAERARATVAELLAGAARRPARCRHSVPAAFVPGQPLDLALAPVEPPSVSVVRLHYRHVNQAERYVSVEMRERNGTYAATIPAAYTKSPFPLQYYFELREADRATLFPGFNRELTNQPYFVVRQGKQG